MRRFASRAIRLARSNTGGDDGGAVGAGAPRSRWLVLAVLALAQFIDTLDVTIVNVGLPHIGRDLRFGASDLQWVISAYTLLYGGFLLLGGRLADLFGRRRLFAAGLATFGTASLAAGLAPSANALIVIRGLQGLGGAMIAPAALSLLTVTFPSGRERNVALGIWGSLAGLGGTFGVVLGGVVIDTLSWRWIFLVNVPIVLTLLAVTPMVLPESTSLSAASARRRPDVLGAVLGTAGLLSLVLAVVRAGSLGFGSSEVVGLLAASAGLLGGFIAAERRAPAPLLRVGLLANRSLTVSIVILAVNGGGFLAMFFLTAVYLQQVLHLSALGAGLEFLPMGIAAIAAAVGVSALITRVGTRPVQFGGAALAAGGLLLLARSDPAGGYASQILPGLLLFGTGILAIGVPTQVAATSEISGEDAGIASGLINTAWQVGGSLGLAVVTALSTSHVTQALQSGVPARAALVSGYHYGLATAAILALINALLVFIAPRLRPTSEMVAAATA